MNNTRGLSYKGILFKMKLLTFALFSSAGFCQPVTFPPGFGKIVPFEMRMAGSFGELRPNHFHAGIDIKTFETEGMPVFAAADGYVSRVKASSSGYGNAIYITHPGKIVTVYGHLRAFYPAIEDTLRKIQASRQLMEVEFFPDKDFFRVSRQQIIGFSGNSGSSEGPHLHFETRHEASEKPFNPALMGYFGTDTVSPAFASFAIYSPGFYNGLFTAKRDIYKVDSLYKPDTIEAGNRVFIGFEAFDLAGTEPNRLGIRSWSLLVNDSLMFTAKIDSFLFDETRMINGAIDYPFLTDSGRFIFLCKKLPGNKLPFYGTGDGLVYLKDKSVNKVKIIIEDGLGNISSLLFYIKTRKNYYKPARPKGVEFRAGLEQEIKSDQYIIKVAKNSFFETVKMVHYIKDSMIAGALSDPLWVNTSGSAIFQPVRISLRADTLRFPSSKLIGCHLNRKGQKSAVPGAFADGYFTMLTRHDGTFYVTADTSAPQPVKAEWEEDRYSGTRKIVVSLRSDFSGLRKYNCFVNGTWMPGEYSSGKNRITIYLTGRMRENTSVHLKIDLTDACENQSVTDFNLVY